MQCEALFFSSRWSEAHKGLVNKKYEVLLFSSRYLRCTKGL